MVTAPKHDSKQGHETNEIEIAEAAEISEDSSFQLEEQDHIIDDEAEFSKCDTDDDNDDEDADDIELLKKASHLSEAGLGSVEVLIELLKAHDGNVQRTIEALSF